MFLHFFDLYKNKYINKSKIQLFYKKKIRNCLLIKDKIDNIKEEYDIYIFFCKENKYKKKIISKIKNIPRFPILYDRIIILNSIHMKYLSKLILEVSMENILSNIYKSYNCVISNHSNIDFFKLGYNFLNDIYSNEQIIEYTQYFERLPFVINCKNNYDYIPENVNGWYSNSNIYQYIINNFDIKIMVELGAWYGRSTKDFIKRNPKMKLYSFDSFQNVFTSTYTSSGNDPLDYFYNHFLRFETFHSNLKKYKNVFSVEYDCTKSLDLLHRFNVEVDLFYIDFLKKTEDLIEFIKKILFLFPKAIILGDDYIINSVKKAILELKNEQLSLTIKTFTYCYIISPYFMDNKEIDKYLEKDNERIKTILKNINNKDNNTTYIIETATHLLENNSFDEFFNYVKKYKIDLNTKINSSFNDSIYISFYKKYKLNNNIVSKLEKYQKPNEYKNSLCLTAMDYKINEIYDLD